jgi:hypothetical protein
MLNADNSRFEPFILFSSKLSEERVDALLATAGFTTVIRGRGSWKGQEEPIWLVPDMMEALQAMTLKFIIATEESFLILDAQEPHSAGRRPVTLVQVADATTTPLGFFTAVTEPEARRHDAWSFIGGHYWLAKDGPEEDRVNRDAEPHERCGKYEEIVETSPNWIA